ncbi:MAG: PA0069 family radical SAM protein [Pseudomonadota bacterium]
MDDMLLPPDPDTRLNGRGATQNTANRFEKTRTERCHDGWEDAAEQRPLRTQLSIDRSRSIIARNTSPDVPFDRSVNPYRGCEHGCTYCFARPSHAQLGYSPGLDFETRLVVKPNAAELLERALRKPGYEVKPIAIGTNTDPYQPIERDHRIMRQVLEVLWAFRHPVQITTKGALITRDLDILGRMSRSGLVSVTISLTTLDNRLSRQLEPRAAAPGRRIATIRALADHCVPVGVNLAPVIPGLTDHEIERLLGAANSAGASHAGCILLRLPLEVAPLFKAWLEKYHPDRAKRIMRKVRETHGGADYNPNWGRRLRGEGPHAQMIARRFDLCAQRLGFDLGRPRLRCDLFERPPRSGDQMQLGL